jgi:hypothetical protein
MRFKGTRENHKLRLEFHKFARKTFGTANPKELSFFEWKIKEGYVKEGDNIKIVINM